MVKAVLFDLDGVIADTMRYHARSFVRAFSDFGINIKERKIYLLEGSSPRDIVDRFAKDLSENDRKNIYRRKKEIFEKIYDRKLFPSVLETIKKLREKGMKIGLVSGSDSEEVAYTIRGLEKYFDVIITSDDIENKKPDPDPYLKALEEIGVGKEESIVVENSPYGVESAKSAGIECLAIATYLPKKYLEKADKVFETGKELEKYLLRRINT